MTLQISVVMSEATASGRSAVWPDWAVLGYIVQGKMGLGGWMGVVLV